jgi:hypothetical protein
MKTEAQRRAHYEARMLTTLIDPTLSATSAKQAENYAAYLLDFYPNQVQMRTLLSAAGILPMRFGAYEAFHGELYHLYRVCTGDSLVNAAVILIDKWSDTAHLGAGAVTLLNQICTVVYHIAFPGTP